LNFFAGTLASTQATIHVATSRLAENLPASFKSAVLVNDIARVRQQNKPHSVHPSALTSGVAHRRSQLIHFALPTLQSRLQRSVLDGLGYSALSLVSTVWLNAASVLEGETAFSLGLFGVFAAIRIGIGRWEKAKEKWWADFARVSGGLKADIEAQLRALLEQSLFKELELVRDRARNSLDEKNDVVRALTTELDDLDQKME
jgi:BMFP domain-containing protein YqiC